MAETKRPLGLRVSDRLGRAIRGGDPALLGISTFSLVTDAIDGGRCEEAKELLTYLWRENKGIHDLYVVWISALFDILAEKLGEEGAYQIVRESLLHRMEERADLFRKLTLEEYTQVIAEFMRGHRSGSNELGQISVRDEGDKYIVESDPCGSGGRLRREAPGKLGVVKGAHPWTWGKTGVPRYCMHCCLNEILSIEFLGFPNGVHEFPDDPNQPCRLVIYKDPKDIPEVYYTRVGKSRLPQL